MLRYDIQDMRVIGGFLLLRSQKTPCEAGNTTRDTAILTSAPARHLQWAGGTGMRDPWKKAFQPSRSPVWLIISTTLIAIYAPYHLLGEN
jgi:hypothetical protein